MITTMVSLSGAKDKFITNLKAKKRTSATILAYNKDISQVIDFLTEKGKTSFAEVTTENLKDFLRGISAKFSPKTVSRKINAIKTFYRFLLEEGVVKEDISALLPHPRVEAKKPRILSRLEYRALRDTCRDEPRTAAIVEVLLQTGIRISELANLKIEDIKEKSIYIRPFESHEGREVPLNKAAKAALNNYLSIRPKTEEKTVFITKNNKPLLVRNIRATIDRYFKRAGINNACVNDLSHTFIYHQLLAGAPVSLVSKIVGHKRLTSTKRYLELIKGEIKGRARLEEL